MPSPRNSVRVVLLIARGWRGTSLPRGNVRKEIQRHRCCSTHTIPQPRVACTIVWQPWAIKSATPTALKHVFSDTISFVLQHDLRACHVEINIINNMGSNDLSNDMHRGIIQYPIPHATICTISCDNPRQFIV